MKVLRKTVFLAVLTVLSLSSLKSFGQQFFTELFLKGSIDKYPIVMELAVWSDSPSIVSGYYYYTSQGSQKRITLSDDLNDVEGNGYYPVLQEYVNGRVTGTFYASYWDTYTMRGTWISADGKKQLPFSVQLIKSEDRSRTAVNTYNGNNGNSGNYGGNYSGNNSGSNSGSNSSDKKISSGMGQFDYSCTISYRKDYFESKKTGRINLPNGDVIVYQFVYECDFLPEYYMKFTLDGGRNITSKYSIVMVKDLKDDEGYVGTDKEGYIDMRISYLGFDPDSKDKMIVLIKKK